jgi:probable rRNA maturation factor
MATTMHEIDVSVEAGDVDAAGVIADLRALLVALALTPSELSVVLTDDAAIRALNAAWRGKDEATDVLSFPQHDAGLEVEGGLLGDLVISLDTAATQAAAQGHDLPTELRVLLVHGLCHLLGHDHLEPGEAAAMAALELRLLGVLGISAQARGLIDRAGAVA